MQAAITTRHDLLCDGLRGRRLQQLRPGLTCTSLVWAAMFSIATIEMALSRTQQRKQALSTVAGQSARYFITMEIALLPTSPRPLASSIRNAYYGLGTGIQIGSSDQLFRKKVTSATLINARSRRAVSRGSRTCNAVVTARFAGDTGTFEGTADGSSLSVC